MSSLPNPVSEIKPKARKSYEKRSLIRKLAEVFSQIDMIEKKGLAMSYEYLRACDVYRVTRGLLMERGVMIFPNILSEVWENVQVEKDGKVERLRQCTVRACFRLEDADSGEIRECLGIGASVGDHTALAAAITGAEKSMLKGLGMIVDEQADPEYDAVAAEPKVFIGKIVDMRKTKLTINPPTAINLKIEDEQTAQHIFANKGEDIRITCQLQVNKYGKQWYLVTDVLIGKFQVAVANQPDLGAVLEASAEQVALINTVKSMGRQHEVSEEEWLKHIAETYRVGDLKKLTPTELTEVIDWIFEVGKKAPQPVVSIAESERSDEIGAD